MVESCELLNLGSCATYYLLLELHTRAYGVLCKRIGHQMQLIIPLEIMLFLIGHLKGPCRCTFNGVGLFDSFLGCRTAPQFCGTACHERRRGVVVGAAGGWWGGADRVVFPRSVDTPYCSQSQVVISCSTYNKTVLHSSCFLCKQTAALQRCKCAIFTNLLTRHWRRSDGPMVLQSPPELDRKVSSFCMAWSSSWRSNQVRNVYLCAWLVLYRYVGQYKLTPKKTGDWNQVAIGTLAPPFFKRCQ